MELPRIPDAPVFTPDQNVPEVFEAIARHQWGVIRDWEPIALDSRTGHGVHILRIGYRRLRSAFMVFRRIMHRDWSRELGRDMKWTAGGLGPARDLHVFATEGMVLTPEQLTARPGGEKFLAILQDHQRLAHKRVRDTLESRRYAEFQETMEGWFKTGQPVMESAETIGEFAARSLDKRCERLLKGGTNFEALPDHELHTLRLHAKKFRYAVDFFRSVFPVAEGDRYILALKDLQDGLGAMNDLAMLPQIMRHLLANVDDEDVRALGQEILTSRRERTDRVRSELPQIWNHWQSLKQPWR